MVFLGAKYLFATNLNFRANGKGTITDKTKMSLYIYDYRKNVLF